MRNITEELKLYSEETQRRVYQFRWDIMESRDLCAVYGIDFWEPDADKALECAYNEVIPPGRRIDHPMEGYNG